MISFRIHVNIFVIAAITSFSIIQGTKAEKSICACSDDITTLSKDIEDLKAEIASHAKQLAFWEMYKEFMIHVTHAWNEDIGKVVNTGMRNNASEGLHMRNYENTVSVPEDDKRQKVKELESSIDKLQNQTMEMEENIKNNNENVMSSIEMTISSIENINRTIYEDHLRKIYSQVDSLVCKNDTRLFNERIVRVETEIKEGCNSSNFLKLAEGMKNIEENLQKLNISVAEDIVPRMTLLNNETVRRDTVEELEDKLIDHFFESKREFLNVWTDIRYLQTSDINTINCSFPMSNDPHLLIDTETETDGTRRLIFGCHPIGQFVLKNLPKDPTCEGDFWIGRYPSCHSLLESDKIEVFSEVLMKKYPMYPCTTDDDIYPDPSNCSRFFTCSLGKAILNTCSRCDQFDLERKVCDSRAKCEEHRSELIQDLEDLIPRIDIEPNVVDMIDGSLGTGPAGQLIVYRRSNFILHCVYPESNWGNPHWNITYAEPERVTRTLNHQAGKNKVSVIVTDAKEEDSGLYRCITPFGKSHGIYISVKYAECLPFELDDEYKEVFYTSRRRMNSEVKFPCTGGRRESAVCKANGKWTKDKPDCMLGKRCKYSSIYEIDDVIVTSDSIWPNESLFFKCANGRRLLGNRKMTCLDDGTWRPSSFPKCIRNRN